MSSNSHSNHPLYAFLQSDPSRHQADPEISAARVQGTSPAEDADSEKIGADRGLNKHLISLLTTVQAHSSQLDQMVKHLNSLVRRVESVESIFSDGQEQIHQSVAEFRSDTEKIGESPFIRAIFIYVVWSARKEDFENLHVTFWVNTPS
ncbi:hypothetical protein PGT21_017560 [Puccinia graminis f. sp. tritici]|uniref:t-SNARE coiled-coil homology domain-containing protein n=1 Tax=Puccinia graminis f. sp. tritici TaxID=56615 RepID=A0A5B0R0X3_PUCGR|nr:hypothetical protein PGT21_017560 [Puccinia graminis f. sp. tritici]